MLLEVKKLFENIKHFRHLITESVGQGDIEKYLQNHEYIYIYYGGDENNKRGYRTIRPYVLDTSTAGNLVVRAWQDRGKSVSFSSPDRRPEHDYMADVDGKEVPGWRMFRLDKIEKVYPTGKKFNKSDGSVMIPPKYKEGSDKDMTSIIAYVSTNVEPVEPAEVTPPEVAGVKTKRWDNFTNGNKNNRKINSDDVVKLRDIASRVYKEKIGGFLVVINNNNDFEIINAKNKDKVPQNAIVGGLANLYDTLVRKTPPEDFFRKSKDKLNNELKENNLPSFPHNIKTFFKQ